MTEDNSRKKNAGKTYTLDIHIIYSVCMQCLNHEKAFKSFSLYTEVSVQILSSLHANISSSSIGLKRLFSCVVMHCLITISIHKYKVIGLDSCNKYSQVWIFDLLRRHRKHLCKFCLSNHYQPFV